MIISSIIVPLFMLWYYRFSGVVANVALVLNMVMLVAIMIMLSAAFTLPGLAGLALTVGMAVDNNVLIYERLREELHHGAALRMAIRNAFHRAGTVIIDANVTHLMAASVLWSVGTDQIKGFAITFWLGAVPEYVDRPLRRPRDLRDRRAAAVDHQAEDAARHRRHQDRLHGLVPGLRHLLGGHHRAGTVRGLLARRGLFDIDFTGGVSVEAVFRKTEDIDWIRRELGKDRNPACKTWP